MVPIRRLLMAGLVLVSTGCLIGCSDNGSNQGSLPPLPQSSSLRLQSISTSLSSPVFMTAPANDTSRLFIVEQGGRIRIFDVTTSSLLATPFLDISGLISAGGEEGLLGMAFDPQYNTNRQFYVYYTNTAGNIVIARYLRNATDPNLADSSSATPLLTVAHPTFSNHNGGMLAFGPDAVCMLASVMEEVAAIRITTDRIYLRCSGNSFGSSPAQEGPAAMSSSIRLSSSAARSKSGAWA
jgi:glucose/arabinose dehydrogenase